MKILSMTATFGKLEHETLTLKPGLNILEAPNEWGKSTWCAFILAMLYGIETRQHTTARELSVKEHYKPWSGRPMSGRMDILWQGREITLERSSKVRAPFGVFSAYETHTGIAVPELTAENCGLMLLGVERSVFSRSSFIRLTDLPVTQDEALRRRLNALVTTGDDSDAGDILYVRLNKLKNACRSNSKNGLLPQALSRQQALQAQLAQLHTLQEHKQRLSDRQQALQQHLQQLQTHKTALQYENALAHHRRLKEARAQAAACRTQVEALETQCATLPSREDAAQRLEQLSELLTHQRSLYMELQLLPQAPTPPAPPLPGLDDPDDLDDRLHRDAQTYAALTAKLAKRPFPLWLPGLLLLAAGIGAALLWRIPGILAAVTGAVLVCVSLALSHRHHKNRQSLRRQLDALEQAYGSAPNRQEAAFAQYRAAYHRYRDDLAAFQNEQQALRQRSQQLKDQLHDLCNEDPEKKAAHLQSTIALWDRLGDARRQLQQANGYVRSLEGVDAPTEAPSAQDTLTYSLQDTDALISDTEAKLRQLQQELGRCAGQMDALPTEEALNACLKEAEARIRQLNTTLDAIALAQETLQNARLELQKRFAPQISRRAQALFSAMTDGRYDRLSLANDLSVRTATADEDTLQAALWRSDGTIDQLYLSLRLAVSEALTPDAPLVLDDALVRFDDARLKAVMALLQQEAEQKQILLFTCQSRESKALSQ